MPTAVRKVVSILFLLALSLPVWAADSSFTQADRDRLTRLEEGLKGTNQRIDEGLKSTNHRIDEGLKNTNQRIDEGLKNTNQHIDEGLKSTNQRIDETNKRMEEGFKNVNQRINDLYGQINVLISVVILSIIATVGLVIWDRRTTLAPAISKIKEIEGREDTLEKTLKEHILNHPCASDTNKRAGLF